MANNATVDSTSVPCDIDNLFPALVECFVIILCGYASGRFGLISSSQSKGIGNFVSLFALPALLFKSMAELDFSVVNWKFLAAILIAKGVVFATVVILTIILGKPQKYGRAGIYGIFCTQSNDFALGLPLMKAMYSHSMPEFINYIYLLAPISLIIINPIGFVLMEFSKHHGRDKHIKKLHIALATIKGVVTNPIVFMTFTGIVANFILKQKIPGIIDGFLTVLGSAFFASSLFFLGLRMVGNMRKQMGYALIVPLLLICSKLLLLPLWAREFIQALDVGGSNQTLTDSWSMFGFLYGTIPTAPTVVIFASKFGVEEDKIAASMVLGTFLSAPILYISAKMVATKYTPAVHLHYYNTIKETIQDSCGVSLACGLWVIAMFILGRRYKLFPQKYTLWLLASQVAFAGAALLCDVSSFRYWHLISFILVSITCLLCRGWTAMVAFSLCLVRCQGNSLKRWQPWIYFYAVGLSVILTGFKLCFVDLTQPEGDTAEAYIEYAENQTPVLVIQVIALILDLVIIIWSLVRLHRCDKYCKCPSEIKGPQSPDSDSIQDEDRCYSCKDRERVVSCNDSSQCCVNSAQSPAKPFDIESLDESTCLLGNGQDIDQIKYMSTSQSSEFENLEMELSIEEYYDGDKHQFVQHVIVILTLAFSICVGLFMCLWYLSNESREYGLFIGMKVLDTILLFGQGFIVFACFGMDKQLIIIPFVKRLRRFFYGVGVVALPPMDELSSEEIHLCEQFVKHHKLKCKRAVVSKKRYRLRTYKNVFSGEQLVSWLTELGLADDRVAATNYGKTLLRGRIIEHMTKQHYFYDLPYLYRFL